MAAAGGSIAGTVGQAIAATVNSLHTLYQSQGKGYVEILALWVPSLE